MFRIKYDSTSHFYWNFYWYWYKKYPQIPNVLEIISKYFRYLKLLEVLRCNESTHLLKSIFSFLLPYWILQVYLKLQVKKLYSKLVTGYLKYFQLSTGSQLPYHIMGPHGENTIFFHHEQSLNRPRNHVLKYGRGQCCIIKIWPPRKFL